MLSFDYSETLSCTKDVSALGDMKALSSRYISITMNWRYLICGTLKISNDNDVQRYKNMDQIKVNMLGNIQK